MTFRNPLIVAFLAACGGDPTDLEETGGPALAACGVTLSDQWPADGEAGVARNTTIGIVLSEARTAGLDIVDSAGQGVVGDIEVDGLELVFVPQKLLTTGEIYTVTVDWCGGPLIKTFTVASPAPVAVAEMGGRVWTFDLFDAVPEALGDLAPLELMLGADLYNSDNELNLVLTQEQSGTGVAECDARFPDGATDMTSNPDFLASWSAVDVDWDVGQVSVMLTTAQGVLSTEDLEVLDLRALVDADDLVGAVGEDPCGLLSGPQACVDCQDGSGAHCLWLRHTGPADARPGVDLDCIQ